MSKRKLKQIEIDDILNIFKIPGYYISENITNVEKNIKKDIQKQLTSIEIYPSLIDNLKSQIYNLLEGEDVINTFKAMRLLGVQIKKKGNFIYRYVKFKRDQ